MTSLFTAGNSAKLYCLNLIEKIVIRQGGSLTLLDLGCGAAANFPKLMEKYPGLRYVGVEPSSSECKIAQKNLSSFNATIMNAPAYGLELEAADVVISFSVLEHVYRRMDYLQTAKRNMKAAGLFLINYDAGHFVDPAPASIFSIGSDRWKNRFGRLMARLGREQYFQAFVREAEFRSLLEETGLMALEGRHFNTDLKNIYKLVPAHKVEEYMKRWLDFELYLNNMPIRYDDTMAKWFRTRNFVIAHQGVNPAAFRWLLDNE